MTLQEYLNGLKNKTVAVIGIGVSNTPLLRLLLQNGIAVTACDKRLRADLGKLADELEQGGAKLQLGSDYLEGLDQDVIFRTPGMHPGNPAIQGLAAKGAYVTSEMEVFFEVCPCNLIAVTGSDGKTTTTTIISEFLKADGKTVWLGGNIGTPLLPHTDEMKKDDEILNNENLVDGSQIMINITDENNNQEVIELFSSSEMLKRMYYTYAARTIVVWNKLYKRSISLYKTYM